MSSTPRVFISYSWDDACHKNWVLKLASDLKRNGINSRLDEWHKISWSITQFMETEIACADFVILVCTPQYATKSNNRQGGSGYEQHIISGGIIDGINREKFIPIIRTGDASNQFESSIPRSFFGAIYIDFRDDKTYSKSLEKLLRRLFDAPENIEPPLGSPPHYCKKTGNSNTKSPPAKLDQPPLASKPSREFSVGDRVRHAVYGTGDVVKIIDINEIHYKIKVLKQDGVHDICYPGELEKLYSRPGWTPPELKGPKIPFEFRARYPDLYRSKPD